MTTWSPALMEEERTKLPSGASVGSVGAVVGSVGAVVGSVGAVVGSVGAVVGSVGVTLPLLTKSCIAKMPSLASE